MTPLRRLLVLLALALPLAVAAPAAAVTPGLALVGAETVDSGAQAQALGSGWVRIFVDWSIYEPADNRYENYAEKILAARIDNATRHGQKVLLVPLRSPRWASGSADVSVPPRDPAKYRELVAHLASTYPVVGAFEVWNEPDAAGFWNPGPDPVAYAALLNAAYDGVKGANPNALVVTGGLVGNDVDFLAQVLDAGGTRFDAVGVHTDTGCLINPPAEQYREPGGRIGRFSFTGYREIRRALLARGMDRPIWMTELGWSTLTTPCAARDNKTPSGVSPEQQAAFLSQAYACLQHDPYVTHAFWFSLQDIGGEQRYDHFLGLMSPTGVAKPAWAAFRAFATNPNPPSTPCGRDIDDEAPKVTIAAPTGGAPFLDRLLVKASATDNQGVSGIEMWVDGVKIGGKRDGASYERDWFGARDLKPGAHSLVLKAYDEAQNVGEARMDIVKADPKTFDPGNAQVLFALKRGAGRRIVATGKVIAPGAPFQPTGTVKVYFEFLRTIHKKGGRTAKVWWPSSRFSSNARSPFRFSLKLKRPGRWRAYALYTGVAPFKPQRTAYTVLQRVR